MTQRYGTVLGAVLALTTALTAVTPTRASALSNDVVARVTPRAHPRHPLFDVRQRAVAGTRPMGHRSGLRWAYVLGGRVGHHLPERHASPLARPLSLDGVPMVEDVDHGHLSTQGRPGLRYRSEPPLALTRTEAPLAPSPYLGR